MLVNRLLSRNIIIAFGVALIVIIALVATARYFIVRDKRAEQKLQSSRSIVVPAEVLHSITPPANAKPAEISQEVLESITPPKGAKHVAINQSILDSITPLIVK